MCCRNYDSHEKKNNIDVVCTVTTKLQQVILISILLFVVVTIVLAVASPSAVATATTAARTLSDYDSASSNRSAIDTSVDNNDSIISNIARHLAVTASDNTDSNGGGSRSNIFDQCTDKCGFIAAIIGLLAYGTYGVPIKQTLYTKSNTTISNATASSRTSPQPESQSTDSETATTTANNNSSSTSSNNVNPFVFQSYKTIVMLIMSFGVKFLGIDYKVTLYYGTLSGLLWVVGGTFGVIAVRFAGMATAIGTWASIMICINFIWGIIIFHEPIANIYNTCCAFLTLCIGIVGMSYYSSPALLSATTRNSTTNSSVDYQQQYQYNAMQDNGSIDEVNDNDMNTTAQQQTSCVENDLVLESISTIAEAADAVSLGVETGDESNNNVTPTATRMFRRRQSTDDLSTPTTNEDTDDDTRERRRRHSQQQQEPFDAEIHIMIPSLSLRRHHNPQQQLPHRPKQCYYKKRTVGIVCAVLNGFVAGSSLLPLHYAPYKGAEYMLSFAIGASIANTILWILYYFITIIIVILEKPITGSSSTTTTTINSNIIASAETTNDSSTSSAMSNHSNDMTNNGTFATASDRHQQDQITKHQWMLSICRIAWNTMPDWQFATLWKPGIAAGILLTTGMFGSILSITYLGQGIGNSIIQCKILVSGLWGIFYYKEIQCYKAIRNWFMSACMTILGIIWISYERMNASEVQKNDNSAFDDS